MRRLLFLLIVLLVSSTAAQDTSASDAPYVFYYSAALNGFVIERADGTDSRIIGQNVMRPSGNIVMGPGWSPSGRWLAWQDVHWNVHSLGVHKGYAVSVDDQPLNLLNEFQCISMMLWHRTKDILLVGGKIHACGTGSSGIATYWLINPASQTILASASIEGTIGAPIYWFDEYIQFKKMIRKIWAPERFYNVTMHYDGRVQFAPISREEFDRPIEGGDEDTRGLRVDRDDEKRQFFRLDFGYSLDDIPFAPPMNSSSAGRYVSYLWDENEQWVLMSYEFCFATCLGIGRRVSIYNPSTTAYREISSCGVDVACVDWLPERVPINELPAGVPESVLPAPIAYAWHILSPETRPAAPGIASGITHELRCSDALPSLSDQVVNLETGLVEYVLPFGQPCTYHLRRPVSHEIVFTFSPDKTLYAITEDTGYGGYTRLHDAVTGQRLVTLNFEGIHLSFSENGRTLHTVGRYASATWDIEAIVTPITMNNRPPAP